MSTSNLIGQVIRAAIERSPALSAFDPDAIYVGVAPEGILPCISLDAVFTSSTNKARTRSLVIHIWMAFAEKPINAGDIHDIGDAFLASLKGTAIFAEQWMHQPENLNNVDHLVIPAEVWLDLL